MKRYGLVAAGVGLAAIMAVSMTVASAGVALAQKAPEAAPKVKKAKAAPKPKSACQGLAKTSCDGKAAACSWVSAATRKDGKKVKAYCRKKSSGGGKAKAPAKPKATPKT